MNKQQLIDKMAENVKLPKKDVEKVLATFVDTVTDELKNGGKVQISGFGSFEVAERAARKGRNPKTSEEILIPASKAPKFKAGSALKNAINV